MAKEAVFKDGQVLRFPVSARVLHSIHTLSFLVLLYTGLARMWPDMSILVGDDLLLGQTIHHIAAVLFVALPLIMLVAFPKGAGRFLKELASWDKDDTEWMKKFIPWMIRPQSVKLPPQGEEKAGQKVSAWMMIICAALIAISGILMWTAQNIPAVLVRWMYVVHDLSMIILIFLGIMHIYMAMLFPATRRGRMSMVTGYVPEEEAKHGWKKWYDGLKKEGEK